MVDESSSDLHDNLRDRSHSALILIDVISDFEFPDGETLFARARNVAPAIARLKRKAKENGSGGL